MNSAIFHCARPGDIRDNIRFGAREVRAAVEADVTIQADDERKAATAQATSYWKMLDDLAATDREGYQKHIDEMAKQAMSERHENRFFIPKPGFSVRATTLQLDKVVTSPPKTVSTGESDSDTEKEGTEIFLNFCSHECVSPPSDASGIEVDERVQRKNLSGLQVPMAVGKPRDPRILRDQGAKALDVVFNPWVLRCTKDCPDFRNQVILLAMRWVEDDNPGMRLNKSSWCEVYPELYKGGKGTGGSQPVKFPVTDAAISQGDDAPPTETGVAIGVGRETACYDRRRSSSGAAGSSGHTGGRSGFNENMKDPQSLLTALSRVEAEEEDGKSQEMEQGEGQRPRMGGSGLELRLGVGGKGTKSSKLSQGEQSQDKPNDIELPGGLTIPTTGSRMGECRSRGISKVGRSPLISEIESGVVVDIKGDQSDGPRARKSKTKVPGEQCSSSGLSKGFFKLRGKKGGNEKGMTPLYPEGSRNGDKAAANAAKNILNRSRVVDMSSMSNSEVEAAMREHAHGTKPPTASKSSGEAATERSDYSTLSKGFLCDIGDGGEKAKRVRNWGGGETDKGKAAVRRSSGRDAEFERLVAAADPDLGAQGREGSSFDDDPLAGELADLAKVLGMESFSMPSTPDAAPTPTTAASDTSSDILLPSESKGIDSDKGKCPPERVTPKPGISSPGVDPTNNIGQIMSNQGSTLGAPQEHGDDIGNGILKTNASRFASVTPSTSAPSHGQPQLTSQQTLVWQAELVQEGQENKDVKNDQQEEQGPGGLGQRGGTLDNMKEARSQSHKNLELGVQQVDGLANEEQESEPQYSLNQLSPRAEQKESASTGSRKREVLLTVKLPPPFVHPIMNGDVGSERGGNVSHSTGKMPIHPWLGESGGPEVVLDVTATHVLLRVEKMYRLSVSLPFRVDAEGVIARYTKRDDSLRVWGREE